MGFTVPSTVAVVVVRALGGPACTAGGGMVTVQMDGQKNMLAVKIESEVAGDLEMLQDMFVAAANEAVKKVDDQIKGKMGGMLGGMGLPPGMF